MCMNNPFNMPRQISPIVKTPTYAAYALITSNEKNPTQFTTYQQNLVDTNGSNGKNGKNDLRKTVHSHHMKTHYSSSIESPALSDSCVDYEKAGTGKGNEKTDSPLSFGSRKGDSFVRILRSSKGVQKNEALLKNAITEARGIVDRGTQIAVGFGAKKGSIGEITQKEYEELYTRKAELYGALSNRYILSPTTLNQLFSITALESKYLKKIKRKADQVVQAKRSVVKNPQNKTTVQFDNTPPRKVDELTNALVNFVGEIGDLEGVGSEARRIRSHCVRNGGPEIVGTICGFLPKVSGLICEKLRLLEQNKLDMTKREKAIEQRENDIKRKEVDLKNKEAMLDQRAGEVNARLEKCEEWQHEIIAEKTQFRTYKQRKQERLRANEQRLKSDWEKLRVLENVFIEQKTGRFGPENVGKIPSRSRQGKRTQKSVDMCSARNKENCGNVENTHKFV